MAENNIQTVLDKMFDGGRKMLRTEIDKDEPLKPGDVIEMHFKAYGGWVYLRAAELAILKWQLSEKNPYWEMIAWDSTTYSDKIVLTFKILEPPEGEPEPYHAGVGWAAIIAVIVLGGGLFAWLCLDKVYKITASPAGKIALAGTGSLGFAALAIAILLLLRYAKK